MASDKQRKSNAIPQSSNNGFYNVKRSNECKWSNKQIKANESSNVTINHAKNQTTYRKPTSHTENRNDSARFDQHMKGINEQCEATSNNGLLNIKQELKLSRQRKKEEKQRLREEEIRRNKVAPKSEHLKIIDQKFKDLVSSKFEINRQKSGVCKGNDVECAKASVSRGFQLNESLDFPDLHSTNKLQKSDLNKNATKRNLQFPFSLSRTVLAPSNENTSTDIIKDESGSIPSAVTVLKKKVRKNTPIEFDIAQALQCARNTKFSKKQNHMRKSSFAIKKRNLLCGNSLDADNPLRRRGKVREQKKKKYTKIKQILINNKQIRSLALNDERLKLQNDSRLSISKVDVAALYRMENGQTQNDIVLDNQNYQHVGCEAGINMEPKHLLHSRKFQSYCDQWPSKEMENAVFNLLKLIIRFQDRYANDPIKSRAKKRFVCGFHEVMRYIKLNKVKMCIIATDIDCKGDETKGGLLDSINQLTISADVLNIPYIYSGSRWNIGRALKKERSISCVAVLNHEGAEEAYKTILNLLPKVKDMYKQKLSIAEVDCGITYKEDVTTTCIKAMLSLLSVEDCNISSKSSTEDLSKSQQQVKDSNPFLSAIMKTL